MNFLQTVNGINNVIAFAVYPYIDDGNINNYTDFSIFNRPRWKNYIMNSAKLLGRLFKSGNNIIEYCNIGAGGICWNTLFDGTPKTFKVNIICNVIYVSITLEQLINWMPDFDGEFVKDGELVIFSKTGNTGKYAIMPLTREQLNLSTLQISGQCNTFANFETNRDYTYGTVELLRRGLKYGITNAYYENNRNKNQQNIHSPFNAAVGMPKQIFVQYNNLEQFGWSKSGYTHFQFNGGLISKTICQGPITNLCPLKLMPLPQNSVGGVDSGYRWCAVIDGTETVVIDETGNITNTALTVQYVSGNPTYIENQPWTLYDAIGNVLHRTELIRELYNHAPYQITGSRIYLPKPDIFKYEAVLPNDVDVFYYWNDLTL